MSEYKSRATRAAEDAELSDDAFAALISGYDTGDYESAHGDGDDTLIVLIRRLGYVKTAEAWEKLGKWYA